MYKNLTWFTELDSPAAHQSLARVIIIARGLGLKLSNLVTESTFMKTNIVGISIGSLIM